METPSKAGSSIQEELCASPIETWCRANRLGKYSGDILECDVETYTDLLELEDDEKTELVQEMNLSAIAKKRSIQSLDRAALELYDDAVANGSSITEYQKELKSLMADAAFGSKQKKVQEQGGEDKSTKQQDGGDAPRTKNEAPEKDKRPKMPPGYHTVPHKVLVLDRYKAMRDNPNIQPSDFASLRHMNVQNDDIIAILVVGPTGSGKTTTINSFVNFLYQVEFEDEFRYVLIEEPATNDRKDKSASQTDQVFGYFLKSPPALDGRHLLIIDSPGFGDTRGLARDAANVREIKQFINKEIDFLHCVCFVSQGSETRLGAINRWVYDQILSLFGFDMKDIVTILFTFCDAKPPTALGVVKGAGVEFHEYFKMNNSGFFLGEKGTNQDLGFKKLYWNVGIEAFRAFAVYAQNNRVHNLVQTRKVLTGREQLECAIDNIRKNVDEGISKLDSLQKVVVEIAKAETLIETNRDFVIGVKKTRRVKKPKKSRNNILCQKCNWTCQEDSSIAKDDDIMRCAAIGSNGYCKSCPKKCHWSFHLRVDYTWEFEEYTQKQTNKELKERFMNAASDKSRFEQIFEGLWKDFDATRAEVERSVVLVVTATNELDRIALCPNTLHKDYFVAMIRQEQKEKKRGWEDRIKMIEKVKDRSDFSNKIKQVGYDPFQEKLEEVAQEARDSKVRSKTVARLVTRDDNV